MAARSILGAVTVLVVSRTAWPGAASVCPWDCELPQDKVVNTVDFLELLKNWGGSGPCDLDGGGIGISDFLALLQHWGPCPPPTNDDCSTAQVIQVFDPLETIEIPFDLSTATASGDSLHCLDGFGSPCGLGIGPCCEQHALPACDDDACCLKVCNADPFCCESEWDNLCTGAAQAGCAVCQKDTWYCLHNETGETLRVTLNSTVDLFIETSPGCSCPPPPPIGCGLGSNLPFNVPGEGGSVSIRLVDSLQLPNDELAGILTISPNPFGCPSINDCCSSSGALACKDTDCCVRICVEDPFCCDIAWDSICADEAVSAPECTCCPCGAGNVSEDELCGTSNNGGCDVNPALFGAAECGDVICGSAWAVNGARDTDWYRVQLPDPDGDGHEILRARLQSQFSGICFLIEMQSGCLYRDVGSPGSSDACLPGTDAVACLDAPGEYFIVVAPSQVNGVPCNGNVTRYTLAITCEPCTCGAGGAGSCCLPHGTPGCDIIECCDAVCDIDSFCCDVAWDVFCVSHAELFDQCGCPAAASGR